MFKLDDESDDNINEVLKNMIEATKKKQLRYKKYSYL